MTLNGFNMGQRIEFKHTKTKVIQELNAIKKWREGFAREYRNATLDEVDVIAGIAKFYSKELGFVMKVALRESVARGSLLVATMQGKIVGFCNYRLKKDGTVTVYEIAVHVSYKRYGIGRGMLDSIKQAITLKCPVDNVGAHAFYKRCGFEHVDTVQGRKRELMVWKRGVR
jgi:ribosomal protein S18 acetylase RimI-like enzyme